MLVLASLVCLALLVFVAALLWRRADGACAQARRALKAGPMTDYLTSLARCVEWALDRNLPGGAAGLAGVEVPHREHQDPYRSVADLLERMAEMARAPAVPFDSLIKATYQLASALAIPADRVEPCLTISIASMQAATATPIHRVERVMPGVLVDAKTMLALNYGSRVAQPLGVTTFDANGKVLSRARVICA